MISWKFPVILSIIHSFMAQKVIKFGAFFDANDVDSLEVFGIAILRQNVFNVQFRLEPIIKKIESMDGYQAEQAVCEMVESGAVAIIGPKSWQISDVVASICNELNIPHLVSYHRTPEINKNLYHMFTRNIHPDTTLLSMALSDIIKNYQWKRFSIIYDSDEGLIRLNEILQMFPVAKKSVTIYQFLGKEMVQHLLKDILKSKDNRIVIDCSIENIAEIMKQALSLDMLSEYMSYFITNPDGHMLNIPKVTNDRLVTAPIANPAPNLKVRSNITTYRLMFAEDVEAMNIIGQWKKKKNVLNGEQLRFAEQVFTANRLKLEGALIRDLVSVIYSALKEKKLYTRINKPPIRCESIDAGIDTDRTIWKEGIELLENIDNAYKIGITGPIRFDRNYKTREDFFMNIVEYEINKKEFLKVAEWNAFEKLHITRTLELLSSEKRENIRSKPFRVVSREGMPYLRTKNDTIGLSGNDIYEGFVKDFMDEIAKEMNITYSLYIVHGNHYGSHDHHTGKWDGIVGDLLEKKADLAICDFTMTYERKTVIDFSSPFMTLGISILFARPREEPIPWSNFLLPLHLKVWLYTSCALLLTSIASYVLSKITEADWLSPHPCDEEPEELENIWNMRNCLWLTSGCFLQQGCDILPKGFPTRLTIAAWWFFSMIIINTYTANLAAFLTKAQMEESISSVEDLAKQTKIKYGLLTGGSTETFFRESNVSLYQKMWAFMEHTEPSVFVKDNEEGIQRVKQSNHGYAYLMESAGIDYEIQRECDLHRVGSWLDSKSYAIGMPMNSPYRDDIDMAILKLKEKRVIQQIKERWWIEKNFQYKDGEIWNCTEVNKVSDSDNPDLDFEHIYGVFLILLIGIAIAIFIGILEFAWNVRKVSIALKITPYEVFRQELLFACKVWIRRKPVLESRESESLSPFALSEKK